MATKKKAESKEAGSELRPVLIDVALRGLTPIVMHSDRLADPLEDITREIKKLSKRTDKDDEKNEQIARLEAEGGLWIGGDGKVCILDRAIKKAIRTAGAKRKLGMIFKQAVIIDEDFALSFDGDTLPIKDLAASREHRLRESVVVAQRRVMRTRPLLRNWAARGQLTLILGWGANVEDVKWALEAAGLLIGLGDKRPEYGRFRVEKFEAVEP